MQEFLACLRNCQLLNKNFAAWNLLLNYVQIPVWLCANLHFAAGAPDYQQPLSNPYKFILLSNFGIK